MINWLLLEGVVMFRAFLKKKQQQYWIYKIVSETLIEKWINEIFVHREKHPNFAYKKMFCHEC